MVTLLDINSPDSDIAHVLEAAIWNELYDQAKDELVCMYGLARIQRIEIEYDAAFSTIRKCM